MLDQRQECLDELQCLDDSRDLAAAFIETIHNQIATLSAEIEEAARIKMQVFWQTEAGQEYWKTCNERKHLANLRDRMRVLQDLRAETMADFEVRRAKD
jgi:hypothetical protein